MPWLAFCAAAKRYFRTSLSSSPESESRTNLRHDGAADRKSSMDSREIHVSSSEDFSYGLSSARDYKVRS
jgi:hypothetical protein